MLISIYSGDLVSNTSLSLTSSTVNPREMHVTVNLCRCITTNNPF